MTTDHYFGREITATGAATVLEAIADTQPWSSRDRALLREAPLPTDHAPRTHAVCIAALDELGVAGPPFDWPQLGPTYANA
jgi:hypothetical protein